MKFSGGGWATVSEIKPSIAANGFGTAIAISHDGSTLLVGSPQHEGAGAAWVFVRDDQLKWIEQKKLTPFAAIGETRFGSTVALSANGNKALVGGIRDNNETGAVWTFTRDEGGWHPFNKLVPPDPGDRWFAGVALSRDGQRALITDRGGARFFNATLTGWQQDGNKLDIPGSAALSGDGKTALIGNPLHDFATGAAFLWTPPTVEKLVAKDAVGPAYFGTTVALASDGNSALIGAPQNDDLGGAAYLFINNLGVESLSPLTGPASGGTTVTLTGEGFSGARLVTFGPLRATSFTVDGPTPITAVSPPGQAGDQVLVSVTTSVGRSTNTILFTYV